MKLKVIFLCLAVSLLLSACSKSSDFPVGSQDVNISQEQKGITMTLQKISYSHGSPTPNYNGMRVVFDISNKSSNIININGSVDPKKVTDNTVIMVGEKIFTPNSYSYTKTNKNNPESGKKEFSYSVPGGFLTSNFEFGTIFDTLSPPDFTKPIKVKIPAKLGDEKLEFVFDLPAPPK
jgi:hypothetical protein